GLLDVVGNLLGGLGL
uniref:Caeridin-2 n=1 Tax=Ranoidea gilleni TaxID=39405 RepID=CDN2_RANGI|nr:RecName: Full=Caeridin-2 [Ranoidea gilleni]prf//1911335B caeridin 2 [Ranoidea caerulea]